MVARSRLTTLPGEQSAQSLVATVALGSDDEVPIWINNTGAKVKITGASFVPDAAVTGNTTNTLAVQFRNKGLLGTGTTGITDVKTYITGTDLVAFKEDALVLSSVAASLIVDKGEVVSLDKTELGTGLALPQGKASLQFEYQGD